MKPVTQSQESSTSDSSSLLRLFKRIRFNSFGFRLFSTIAGSALIGIGGMAFLFEETVKYQAEEQIRSTLAGKVGTVDDVLDHAESLAYGLGVSVSTLHMRGAETQGTYQELARQLFEGRDEFVIGLGFGQTPNGVLPSQEWFFPYYQAAPVERSTAIQAGANQADANQASRPIAGSTPDAAIAAAPSQYINRADLPYFYPATAVYQQYFQSKENTWTAPYLKGDDWVISYYSQIFDGRGTQIGTAVVDLDNTYLSQILDESVLAGSGQFLLVDKAGNVIADPENQGAQTLQTYQNIPDLDSVWARIDSAAPGFIEGEAGYWASVPVPEHDWLILAYVPYRAVFTPLLATTAIAALLVTLLLGGSVAIAIRYLNRRLRPVIDECQRLSAADEAFSARLKNKDELEQLSLSFFNLLEQLKLSKTEIQKEAAHALAAEEQLEKTEAQIAAARMRQQQVAQKLKEMLPSESEQAIENRTLQRELSRLSEVVSTLATDDLLFSAIATNQDNTLSLEDEKVGHRLSHTFSQVLSALDHFSTLVMLLGKVTNRIAPLDSAVAIVRSEIAQQVEAAERAQQQVDAAEVQAQSLAKNISAIDQASEVAFEVLATSQADVEAIAHMLATFQRNAERLSMHVQLLIEDTQQTTQASRKHQRMVSSAQVLLSNAVALSMSAARPHKIEDSEDIVRELKDRSVRLQQLVGQLENNKPQQSDRLARLESAISDLQTGFGVFRQSAQAFGGDVTAYQQRIELGRNSAQQIVSESLQAVQSNQEVETLLRAMQQSIRELSAAAKQTQSRADSVLQETQQVEYLTEEIAGATSTFLLEEGK